MRAIIIAVIAATTLLWASGHANNDTFRNDAGRAGTVSSQGAIDFSSEFFKPQGTNGRSCVTCHTAEDGWSINPGTMQRLFDETEGLHPVFNRLDANNPTMDRSTPEARLVAYSMMLSRGVFRRGGEPKADAEWELVDVDDPHGFATLSRLVHWRRPLPTINFPIGSTTVHWDGALTSATQREGLEKQATRNVTGGQEGPPAPPAVIANIVDFESSLFTAQVLVHGVGRLDSDGARGGPDALAGMPRQAGRFDLFDAWVNHDNPRRAQIARGQELFNNGNGTGRCSGCHNSANDGTNMNGAMFDVRSASAEARTPDLPLYTFRNRTTNETRKLSDAGRGNITGLWRDLGRFKTPTLRGLSSRAPYFHNGIAASLEDVVRHYERHLGFVFSDEERADLVAFLKAL